MDDSEKLGVSKDVAPAIYRREIAIRIAERRRRSRAAQFAPDGTGDRRRLPPTPEKAIELPWHERTQIEPIEDPRTAAELAAWRAAEALFNNKEQQ